MWGTWFGGSGAQKRKDAPKKAILDLRQQLDMLQKREKHLENQMAEQEKIAKMNVSTNKTGRSSLPARVPLLLDAGGVAWCTGVAEGLYGGVKTLDYGADVLLFGKQRRAQPSSAKRPTSTPSSKPLPRYPCSRTRSIPSNPQTSTKKRCWR